MTLPNLAQLRMALAGLLMLPALMLPMPVAAQAYPNRQIQLLVPYPAGGTTDVMARVLQEPLQRALGQNILIDNKGGAAGVLAAREAARSKPDGYTLLFVNSGILAVTPQVQKDAGFDGVKDFAPVALVTTAPLFVIVPASLPVTDLRGFVDYARKQSQPIMYASAGAGSFGHLSSELFARAAGLTMVHVPYKGQAPTTTAVMTGEVSLLITSMSTTMREFITAGRLKLLAVTSAEASALAPGVPTVASVLPGYVAETWFGVVAAAGTPPDIVNRLNAEFAKAVKVPEVAARMTSFGQQVSSVTPQRLGQMIAEDSARWGAVIRESGIKAD